MVLHHEGEGSERRVERREKRDASAQNSVRTKGDVDRGKMDIFGLVLVSHVERVDLEMGRERERRKEREGGRNESSPS